MVDILDRRVYTSPGVTSSDIINVRASLPVIGQPHQTTARAINWLLGRGHVLAVGGPALFPVWEVCHFSFWVHPDDLHLDFNWSISLSGQTTTGAPAIITGSIDITVHPAGTTIAHSFTTPTDGSIVTLQLREQLDVATNDPMEIHMRVAPFSYGEDFETLPYRYVLVHGVHVMESPQLRLDFDGVSMSSFDARRPIFWPSSDPEAESVTALVAMGRHALDNYARRGSLFSWWDPRSVPPGIEGLTNGWQTSATSFEEIFPVKPAIQTRHLFRNVNLGTVRVNVCAKVSGGTGEVRVTMTNGSTYTWSISSIVINWQTEQDLQAKTDDPSLLPTNGGIRDSTRDEVTFEARAASGQTITVVGLCISEGPTSGGAVDEDANVLVDGGTPITYGGEYIFVPIPFPP